MQDNLVAYLFVSISQLFCFIYSIKQVYYYKRKAYRSFSVDVVAGTIYFLFSLYYNTEFWTFDIMSCKTAHAFAVSGVSLVGPAFSMQIYDLYYTRALHSYENFAKIKEFNFLMSLYKKVHDHLLYAILFFVANAGFLLAVLMPPEFPSYDGLWMDPECKPHSRTFSVIIPKYVFILGNLIMAILLYKWKEGVEFRFYMIYSMIAIGSATIIWSMMFEFVNVQGSTLPYIWVCSFWIFLLTSYGNIVDRQEDKIIKVAAKQGFVDDIPNTIEEVFNSPFYLEMWKRFVTIEFSTENTLCYLELIKLGNNQQEQDKFIKQYIKVGSNHEVNISDALRKNILSEKVISEGKKDLLRREILQLMRVDTFSRFPAYARKEKAKEVNV